MAGTHPSRGWAEGQRTGCGRPAEGGEVRGRPPSASACCTKRGEPGRRLGLRGAGLPCRAGPQRSVGVPPGWQVPPGTLALERVERPGRPGQFPAPGEWGAIPASCLLQTHPKSDWTCTIPEVARLLNLLTHEMTVNKETAQGPRTGHENSPPTVYVFILKSSFWLSTAILHPPQSPEKQPSASGRVHVS